jgi:hypothetical protein
MKGFLTALKSYIVGGRRPRLPFMLSNHFRVRQMSTPAALLNRQKTPVFLTLILPARMLTLLGSKM